MFLPRWDVYFSHGKSFWTCKWLGNSLLACISISEIQKSILNNLLHHGFFVDIWVKCQPRDPLEMSEKLLMKD